MELTCPELRGDKCPETEKRLLMERLAASQEDSNAVKMNPPVGGAPKAYGCVGGAGHDFQKIGDDLYQGYVKDPDGGFKFDCSRRTYFCKRCGTHKHIDSSKWKE